MGARGGSTEWNASQRAGARPQAFLASSAAHARSRRKEQHALACALLQAESSAEHDSAARRVVTLRTWATVTTITTPSSPYQKKRPAPPSLRVLLLLLLLPPPPRRSGSQPTRRSRSSRPEYWSCTTGRSSCEGVRAPAPGLPPLATMLFHTTQDGSSPFARGGIGNRRMKLAQQDA